jgi:hypothetical protein
MATSSRVRPERKGYDVIIFQQHVDRLKKMQPTVDAGPPRAHPLSNKREMDKVMYTQVSMSVCLCLSQQSIPILCALLIETRVFEH